MTIASPRARKRRTYRKYFAISLSPLLPLPLPLPCTHACKKAARNGGLRVTNSPFLRTLHRHPTPRKRRNRKERCLSFHYRTDQGKKKKKKGSHRFEKSRNRVASRPPRNNRCLHFFFGPDAQAKPPPPRGVGCIDCRLATI